MSKVLPILLALAISFEVNGQKLFSSNNPLEISITVSFQDFVDNIEDDDYVDGRVNYQLKGRQFNKEVRLKARGHFRLKHCMIPPIKIHFNDDDYGIDLFNEIGKVKLVTGCTDKPISQDYLVKEYLVYQMYETFTEYSLKTYFMNIQYINADDSTDHFNSYGFLIQDADDLADELKGKEVNYQKLSHKDLDDDHESIMTLFDYMIGNLDLFVYNLHNIKLIEVEGNKPVPVPYDFDFSGFVNADYAYGSKEHGQKTVRDRYYVGTCRSKEDYAQLFDLFKSKRSGINSLIKSNRFISKDVKEDAKGYIDEFYEILESSKMTRKKIIKKCYR